MDRVSKAVVIAIVAIVLATAAVSVVIAAEDPKERVVTYHSQRDAEDVIGDTVSECMFEREGYAFDSWNTEADGTGDAYMPGDSLEGTTGARHLYAQWVPVVESVLYTQTAAEMLDAFVIVYDDGTSVKLDSGVRLDGGAHLEVRCDGLDFSLGDDGLFYAETPDGTLCVDVRIFMSVIDQTPYVDPDTGYACYSFTPGGGVAFTLVVTLTSERSAIVLSDGVAIQKHTPYLNAWIGFPRPWSPRSR